MASFTVISPTSCPVTSPAVDPTGSAAASGTVLQPEEFFIDFTGPELGFGFGSTRVTPATMWNADGNRVYARDQLMENSNLTDSGPNGFPDGWVNVVSGTAVASGASAVSAVATKWSFTAAGNTPFFSNTVTLAVGQYIASVYVDQVVAAPTGDQSVLRVLSGTGTVAAFASEPLSRNNPGAGKWAEVRFRVTVAGTVEVRVGLGSTSSSTGQVVLSAACLNTGLRRTHTEFPGEYLGTEDGDEPRFAARTGAHRFISGAWRNRGLWVEALARTNSLLRSRNFIDAAWTVLSGLTVTQNAVGIDGVTNSAFTMTDTAGVATRGLSQAVAIPADTNRHFFSLFVRKATTAPTSFPEFALNLSGGTGTFIFAQVNLQTGASTIRTSSGTVSIQVQDFGLWWRVVLSVVNNLNTTATVSMFPARGNTLGGNDPTATGSMVVDAAQLELNVSSASSPIDTFNAAVTRGADLHETSTVGLVDLTRGTFVVDYLEPGVGSNSTVAVIFQLGDFDDNVRITVDSKLSGSDEVFFQALTNIGNDGGVSIIDEPHQNKINIAAVSYKQDRVQGFLNGVASAVDTLVDVPMTNAPSTLAVGSQGTGSNGGMFFVRSLRYIPNDASEDLGKQLTL